MRKQITYNEAYFDPHSHVYDYTKLTPYSIETATDDEYNAVISFITDPNHGIPQDSIHIIDLPPIFTEQEKQRADIDYIAIMAGVNLDV